MSNLGGEAARNQTLTIAVKKNGKLDNKFLKSYPIFWISLLCAKYLGQDCLGKQIFGRNSAQSPSNLNFWTFAVTSKHFSNHDENIKQVSCVKVPNLMVLC